jgi:uncharacterized membrane protein YdbT with pleckstrin-like domain
MSQDYSKETQIWRGSPSQWTNLPAYTAAILVGAAIYYSSRLSVGSPASRVPQEFLYLLILPAFYAFARWLRVATCVYEITTERIRVSTGLLSRRTTELELYRVRDYTVEEPLLLRLINRGDLILSTADRSSPSLVLHAVPNVTSLKDQIRAHTERMRKLRGVRDLEIDPRA